MKINMEKSTLSLHETQKRNKHISIPHAWMDDPLLQGP